MNPQCGYYQSNQRQQNYGASNNFSASQSPQGYGRRSPASCGSGSRSYSSTTRFQPTQSRSTYGYCSDPGSRSRGPPVFSSMTGNAYRSAPQGYPAQSTCGKNSGFRQQQQTGRSTPLCGNNYKMAYQQPQQCSNQHPLAPAPFCTPQAIKVNVTAEQLQNARNTPYQDRGEPSVEGEPGAKYIQLNWQDLLGGMDNLRVSMVPSSDPCNENRQLKVSFGGQKTDPPQAGETSLKVLSIEPANSGRMDYQKGNALASSMKVCSSPITNISPTPTNCPPRTQPLSGANGNYRQNGYGGGSCRRQ